MTTQQQPLGSGFGPASTAAEVIRGIDLSGKVAVVTGAASGIGLVTARELAQAGATVVAAVRDIATAQAALGSIPNVEIETLELMDPASIDAFATRFLASGRALDILVDNAGIMAAPLKRDARGYESQFATNHLGHFQLTARLWPALRKAGQARVVVVSSLAHAQCPPDLDDPNFERHEYERWRAYSQSKSANIQFALELDARGQAHGIRAYSLHPGAIITKLARHVPTDEIKTWGMIEDDGTPIVDPANDRKNPEQGAATSVWCATSPLLEGKGGVYCEDSDIAAPVPAGTPHGKGARPWCQDRAMAATLWALSEKLTGITFAAD